MFADSLLPDKSIFVSSGFDFGAIHEEIFTTDFFGFQKDTGQLPKQLFTGFGQKVGTESGYGAVVRSLIPGQEPHEVDIAAAGLFDLSAGIDALRVSVYQDLEHQTGFDCRISPFLGVRLIKTVIVQLLQHMA